VDTKRTIRKILFATVWLTIGTGMVILLAAAIGKKNKERCSDFRITVKGSQDHFFIEDKDVLQLLTTATHGKIKGQPMSTVDLHRLEGVLENNVWIKEAQLYFDNNDVLHVSVTEREPIARIFTTGNKSFYIDNDLKKLPLSDRVTAKVPVFTDYPEKIAAAKDSALLIEIKNISEFILSNSFWMSQVAQIDMDNDYKFEMIPVLGNHRVELGDGENIEEKFGRLMVFYKDVLSKTGFDKYASIDVRFDGQVVATKGKSMTKVDSVQLRKNVEKLLQQAQQMKSDTTFTTNQTIEKPIMTKDTLDENDDKLEKTDKTPDPAPLKSSLKPKPDEKSKKPKAVMPKKN
jgi:cell division protein FtsQ